VLKELNRHPFSLVNIVKPGLLVFLSTEASCIVGWKSKLIQPLWKTEWRFLKKIKN